MTRFQSATSTSSMGTAVLDAGVVHQDLDRADVVLDPARCRRRPVVVGDVEGDAVDPARRESAAMAASASFSRSGLHPVEHHRGAGVGQRPGKGASRCPGSNP